MNFVGTGKRLAQGDVGFAAKTVGLPTSALLAFIEVEANGRGFDSRNRPVILFEPHRFWKNLGAGAKRDQAARQNLAYAKWGTLPYPKGFDARYDQLTKAMLIDANAALKSASWGLPQILGENYAEANYVGPSGMVEDFKIGEREQLLAMCRLLVARGLDKKILTAIKTGNWVPVAENYNGKLQARHDYSGRLKRAFDKHEGRKDEMAVPAMPRDFYVKGDKGEAVMNFQRDLVALGFDLGPDGADGRFGGQTDKAVREYQAKHGLTVDGKVGNATLKSMGVEVAKLKAAPEPAHTWPEQSEIGKPNPANNLPTIIASVVVALVLAAVAFFTLT